MQAFGDDPAESRLVIRIFGALEIVDGERVLGPRDLGGVRPKQLLEILLAARGHLVPVDRIADLIWDNQPPNDIAASIQTFVSVLRRRLVSRSLTALGNSSSRRPRLTASPPMLSISISITSTSSSSDQHGSRHESLASRSSRRCQSFGATRSKTSRMPFGRKTCAAATGDACLALVSTQPMLHLRRWTLLPRSHTPKLRISLDRFSERAQRLQMLSLYALGRTHDALDRYRDYRIALDEDLGLEPSADTRAVEAAVIRQEDVRALLPRPIEPVRTHSQTRSVRLVGRSAELDALTETVRQGVEGRVTLIQIEGTTGLGKTRLARRASRASRWVADRARDLLAARTQPLLCPARGCTSRGARGRRTRRRTAAGTPAGPSRARTRCAETMPSTSSRRSRRSSRSSASTPPSSCSSTICISPTTGRSLHSGTCVDARPSQGRS